MHFIVQDTSIGLPKEKQRVIFEAFSQPDGTTTRKYGGMGLDLTISLRLVEMMQGSIRVESEGGRGSHFHFTVRFGTLTGSIPRGTTQHEAGLDGLRVADTETPTAEEISVHLDLAAPGRNVVR